MVFSGAMLVRESTWIFLERAPASVSARAVAAPIPLEAPVTMARLPSRAAIPGEPTRRGVNGPLKLNCPADV